MTDKLTESAPPTIWLQVDTDGDADDRSEPLSDWSDTTWCSESIGGQEVEYTRSDIAAAEIARLTAELEKCREDAERWNHCIAVGRFPSICQDGSTWVAWKTESPTSSVSGKSPGQAIDAARRSP